MKTVIITGANGNLGVACVQQFLQEDYRVIAVDGKDNQLGFARDNKHFSFFTVDLGNEAAAAAFVENTIKANEQIHTALLLVGGFASGNIAATEGAQVQKMFSLNFETAYFLARPLLAHMQSKGNGRLVFIGARPALQPAQGKDVLAYALTKSMLFTLAACINEECRGSNVTASVVVPSIIDTALNRKSMPDANPADWVSPAAIAEVMAFISSGKGDVLRESIFKVYNNA
ncbi:MAG TPA: SDR family NAD(P)-dependent oxidoreductase [Chitinophagaceae bacterium]|nr:SDR family NAD(P)-dependent oxidoreductase [Chitinophagaceae bacterium]